MNMLTLLLENQSQPTWTLRIPPSKQLALREIPSTIFLAWKNIKSKSPNTAQSPTSRLWYLSNYHDALQAHIHPLHKYKTPIRTVTNYHEYCQTLIKNGTTNGAVSNAYLTASCIYLLKFSASYEVRKKRRQWKPFPTSIKEKEPLWYRVL